MLARHHMSHLQKCPVSQFQLSCPCPFKRRLSLQLWKLCIVASLTSTFKLHFQPLQRFSEPLSGHWQVLSPGAKLPSMPCSRAGFVPKVNCEAALLNMWHDPVLFLLKRVYIRCILYCQKNEVFIFLTAPILKTRAETLYSSRSMRGYNLKARLLRKKSHSSHCVHLVYIKKNTTVPELLLLSSPSPDKLWCVNCFKKYVNIRGRFFLMALKDKKNQKHYNVCLTQALMSYI